MDENINIGTELDIVEDYIDSYVEGENITYTSGDVAKIVGISRDMVRYYTVEFEEFIMPDKTTGGHLRYKSKDIDILKLILSLLKTHTTAEIKELLRDKDIKTVYENVGDEYHGLLKLLLENNKYLADLLVKGLSEKLMYHKIMMLEQKQKEEELYNTIIKELDYLKKENEELKELIKKAFKKEEESRNKRGFWKRIKRKGKE